MKDIGIRIFWGPWGGEFAPTPLVSVGEVVGEIEPMPPSLVKEEKSWMLKIDNNKTVYSCYSKEPCTNADSFLQLLVCAIIPTGQRLANGKSPLELLTAIRDQFGLLFTFNIQYTPPNIGKVNGRFGQLIARYPMEECPWYDFRMEGTEAASFCVDSIEQLNALMLYHAYTPLAFIEHLELGFQCKSTVDINTKGDSGETKKEKRKWWQREKRPQAAAPSQPKPQEDEPKTTRDPSPTIQSKATETIVPPTIVNKGYQIWVNGEPQNVFLRWDDDEYYLHKESTEDYRYEGLRVKLGDLKAAPKRRVATLSGKTVAQLDEKNNRVNCEMKPVERWLLKEIAFTSDSDVEARKFVKYNPDKIQILIGREPWTDDKIKPSLAKKAVEKNNIRIVPKEVEGCRFSVASAKIAKDKLVVMTEAKNMSNKTDERKPADIRREPIVNQKNVNKEIGKDKTEPTKRSKPNWASEVKVWCVYHPILFDLIIVCVVVLTLVSALLIFQAKDRKEYQRHVEERAADDLAAYQQCITASQCRQYINNWPCGEYRHQVDSILNVFVQDSLAEKARDREKAAYYMCLNKDVVVSYNACVDYLEGYPQGTYWKEVDSLRNKVQKAYGRSENNAYSKCKRVHNYEDVCKACRDYQDLFRYGEHLSEVASIEAELEKVRSDELVLLNKGEIIKRLDAKYFNKSERLAVEIIMGRNLMDQLETYLLDQYLQRHGFKEEGGHYKFKSWDDVSAAGTYARDEWYRSTKEWNDHRNIIMRAVNERNSKALEDDYRSYLTDNEEKAVEWLLSLKQGDEVKYDCLKYYIEGRRFNFDGWYQIESVYKEANKSN